jgi:hypothetical protein
MSFLDNLFKVSFEACEKMADAYIQLAIEQGQEFDKKITNEKVIRDH